MALRLDWRCAALYSIATPILGWLLWARFCYEPAPEFGQLLSQINANLRLANSIPARDKDGNPVYFADSQWMLDQMIKNNPDIRFHFLSDTLETV